MITKENNKLSRLVHLQTKFEICPLCATQMESVFSELVLGKFTVEYLFCEGCGFLKTEKPYWLEDAYKDAIADTDIGLVNRNLINSKNIIPLLDCIFKGEGIFLDVSGGYGLLTRLLRDKGFNCYTTDKYCVNLFAKGFEPTPNFRADALFAFEVIEHIENPLQFFRENILKYNCKTLIFSTQLFGPNIPDKNWWYYSFETGQHITFYQYRTLSVLAEQLGCKYYRVNNSTHLFTDLHISTIKKFILFSKMGQILYNNTRFFTKKKSLTIDDFEQMKQNIKHPKDETA